MTKTYTLELTADELRGIDRLRGRDLECSLIGKLIDLGERARADQTADELRLPWVAVEELRGRWCPIDSSGRPNLTERAAKLRAAAPELLVAVDAAEVFIKNAGCQWRIDSMYVAFREALGRAHRKLNTGVPE